MGTPKLNGYGRLLLLIVAGILLLGFGLGMTIGLSSCASSKNVASDSLSVASSEDTSQYVRDQPYKAVNYANQVPMVQASQPKGTGFLGLGKRSGKQKIKNSTIILQQGTGNTAAVPTKTEAPVQVGPGNKATDNREAGADGGAAGIGKNNTLSVSTNKAGTPWYVFVVLVLVSVGGGWVLRSQAASIGSFK
ncbi:hypothetical protein [Hymenobacter fodinae]|uniref:Uncharacterized protein n=1 Tax=Hymenobacter fodinae TaxID=2510796 RepID=A0A4Z0P3K5_9BACT|nr:hypothetical protein [Hymenobacter fodinae]TGE04749.1 hypothetical protein EU556_21450 [Hymenobacter fodinae]